MPDLRFDPPRDDAARTLACLDLTRIDGDWLRRDPALQAELAALAAPSYDDPGAILAREVADCSHLYLGHDRSGQLAGFCLSRRDAPAAGQDDRPLVHVGWSACREDLKNSGAAMALFERCIRDVQDWERQIGRRALLWSTTASPTIYLGVARHLAEVEPRRDGGYSAEGADHVRWLRKRLGFGPAADGEHPFVLRGVARATRYSAREAARVARVCARKRFDLFETLGIEERREDRLLFIARTPDDIGDALARASRLAAGQRLRAGLRSAA